VTKDTLRKRGTPIGHTRRAFLAAAASATALSASAAGSLSANSNPALTRPRVIRWLAYYGVTGDESVLATYDIVILDPAFQGSISLAAGEGAHVCGYLSLGEIKASDPSLAYLDPSALLPENPDWPGTRRVDIRDPTWRSLILDRQIPSLASQGFTGLMLDTLDTPPYLELSDPARYQGMREAAISLVECIRARWPEMMLIVNRGYALLPELVDQVDAVIAESLMTSPDLKTGGFAWVDPRQLKLQLSFLKPAASRRPPLPVLSLDYWDPNDATTIGAIYRRERELGHHPYVATRLLDQIVPEEP
jgi:polysaccharide biosynthesis protein PelA